MASFLTYNNIIDILTDIANRHQQINTFYVGENWEIENDADIVYPVLQVYPTLARLPRNTYGEYKTIQINMNCKVVNLTRQDNENEKDIYSDMLQVAQDIINELSQNPYFSNSNVSILNDISITQLNEFNDDYTNGWEWELSFQLINNNTWCGLPFDPIEGISYNGPVSTGYTYTATFGCADLVDCPIIVDLGDDIIQINSILSGLTGQTSYQYWTSGSTGNYSIKANNDSGLDATGDYAVAEGAGNISSNYGTHAEGINTTASGFGSHSEGSYTISSGIYSHAEGYFTTASGARSHAEGRTTTAEGVTSHAEGRETLASGQESHAEGRATISSGLRSHAEGEETTASGEISHSEGQLTTALGNYSHAGGSSSVASGETSFVHGNNSVAGGIGTIVLGNGITGTTDNTVYVPNFVIRKSSAVPTSSADSIGENGSVTWDNNYFYWKANGQWLRISGSIF